MIGKMTTNSQLSTNEPKKKNKTKQKLSKQLEQEQNQKNGHHRGISVGRRKGGIGGKCTGKKQHN